jgi:hypothetical protein
MAAVTVSVRRKAGRALAGLVAAPFAIKQLLKKKIAR